MSKSYNKFAQFNANTVTEEDISKVNLDRKLFTDGIGTSVQDAHSLEVALKIAGLDFQADMVPAFGKAENYFVPGKGVVPELIVEAPDSRVVFRTDTNAFLGMVGSGYEILQNHEAFDFLDSIVAGGAKFETAGVYGKYGQKMFITISTEEIKILDDNILPYILFCNSFGGDGSVKAMFVPNRVICSNMIIASIKASVSRITIRHSKSMKWRLEAAKETLLAQTRYLEELKRVSEELAVKPFSKEAFNKFLDMYFPERATDSELQKTRNIIQLDKIRQAYEMDDVQNYKGSAYAGVLAISDFESHFHGFRQTKTTQFSALNKAEKGMPMLNTFLHYVGEAV